MKKILILISALLLTIAVNAQFTKGTGIFLSNGSRFMAAPVEPPGPAEKPSFIASDGYTFGEYIADADNLTLNGSEVDYWNDVSGSANHLYRAGSDQRPNWDAVNGEVDFTTLDELRKTSVVETSPFTIYAVIRINTPSANSSLITLAVDSYYVRIIVPTTTTHLGLIANTGYIEPNNDFFTEDEYFILRVVINDDVSNGSKLQINENTAYSGTLVSVTSDRIRIGAGNGNESNTSIKYLLFRANLDDNDEQAAVIAWLNDTYSVY